jgi:Ricin-type beta-trefoil lectin domain
MNLISLSCSAKPQAEEGHHHTSARAAVVVRTRGWASRVRRSLILVAAAGFAVAGMVTAPSAGAATAPASAPAVASLPAVNCGTTPCFYRFRNQASVKCMGMPSTAGGTQAIQNTCNANNSQYWKAVPTSLGFLLQNRASRRCLVVTNVTPGSAVVQRACNGANRRQNWFLGGSGDNIFVFYNIATAGHCGGVGECAIHPSGNSTAAGAKLYVQTPTSNCTLVQVGCTYAWVRLPGGRG